MRIERCFISMTSQLLHNQILGKTLICTAVDFQCWSKMTLKIKMACISIFRVGSEKFFNSHS